VRDDVYTDVMRRSRSKGFVLDRPRGQAPTTISLVCRDRTLDFEVDAQTWTRLFHAFKILKNHFHDQGEAPGMM